MGLSHGELLGHQASGVFAQWPTELAMELKEPIERNLKGKGTIQNKSDLEIPSPPPHTPDPASI